MVFKNVIHQNDALKMVGEKDVLFIDCRFMLNDISAGENEYRAGHIPGAVYAHLDRDLSGDIKPGITGRHPLPSVQSFQKRCQDWGLRNDQKVIAYDHGHGGVAARLWWLLRYLGHTKVAVLDGGWKHWIENNSPTNRVIPHPQKSDWKPLKSEDWIVHHEAIFENMDSEKYCLLDAREAKRYRGEEEPIDPVAGHIPGALSMPFLENLKDNLLWKSPQEIKERFQTVVDSDREVVAYCGSGVTACHLILALDYAGLPTIKLYPGSWSDWITHTEYPIGIGEK